MSKKLSIHELWRLKNFEPNSSQEAAILHVNGPLFLTAGPGSGKTRVLLWRTLNLIVFHDVKPEEIFLSTFTEKAAFQLKEGLRTLLGIVTNETGTPYDIAKMAIGTVHSICQRILTDRRFSIGAERPRSPKIMDELDQYFFLYDPRVWNEILKAGGFDDQDKGNVSINEFIANSDSSSRHVAVSNCIALFNRFSEECLDPAEARRKTRNPEIRRFLDMYEFYLERLAEFKPAGQVDLSLLQQRALDVISRSPHCENIFKHLIIDEYQDTNTVQERIFFKLAKGSRNICIVGDDDQALYRFRGATVENLVEFPNRCEQYLGVKPQRIDLDSNYRSRDQIVHFYSDFINRCDWKRKDGKGFHRVHDKKIKPMRQDKHPSVLVSSPASPNDVYDEIANFVHQLIKAKKVEDPNQIAFLFPAMKSNDGPATRVKGFRDALEARGLKVYAPRAGRFLQQEEAMAIVGLFLLVFERPEPDRRFSGGLRRYYYWLSECESFAKAVVDNDKQLKQFIEDKRAELEAVREDYSRLFAYIKRAKWNLDQAFTLEMRRKLAEVGGISERAKATLSNKYFEMVLKRRIEEGNPFTVKYVLIRTTSLDWSVLDLFYQLQAFKHFRELYRLAETGQDEGPLCNLGIISDYLARFMDKFSSLISGSYLEDQKFQKQFFLSYLYALFRLQESEYEDEENPFPKGRIPFLSIHQAKGLEFPVVVLGTPFKQERGPSKIEEIVRTLLDKHGEPLERIEEFDIMRMFYVALSRPKNLLIIPHYKGQGQRISEPFKKILEENHLTRIKDFDHSTLPVSTIEQEELGKNYSYTGDFLQYRKCPRQYMVFKKYGFVPSRSQTMFFGSLVHKTIEDLHYMLMGNRS